MDEQLVGWFEKISQRTEMPMNELVKMALWDFVRSFDWNYEELKQGVIYRAQTTQASVQPVA